MTYRKVRVHTPSSSFFAIDIRSMDSRNSIAPGDRWESDKGGSAHLVVIDKTGKSFEQQFDNDEAMSAEFTRIKTIWSEVVDEEIKDLDADKQARQARGSKRNHAPIDMVDIDD